MLAHLPEYQYHLYQSFSRCRANILLGDKMNAKLGDFGLIRVQNLVDNGHTNVTQDVHGTTLYMPPEAMQGVISPKWDIYSFGVVRFM